MSRKGKNIIDQFFEHLQEHEPIKLALTEAVCNFYYAHVSDKDVDVNGEDWQTISDLYSTLWCEIPDWRYRFKQYLERYNGEKITTLPIDSKPREIVKLSTQFNIVRQGSEFTINLEKIKA